VPILFTNIFLARKTNSETLHETNKEVAYLRGVPLVSIESVGHTSVKNNFNPSEAALKMPLDPTQSHFIKPTITA